MTERKVVIPGEAIAKGNNFLPGEGTERNGEEIIALKYGLAEETNNLVKVIPLSGVYQPRRGNVVIGKIENVTFNGWVVEIGSSERAFLSVAEFPQYVPKNGLEEVMDIGEMIVTKIWSLNKRGIDLSMKSRGLGKIDEGIILEINPNKVPRIIGKEGSMINLIKENTGCKITVGQNGIIWIKGNNVEEELSAKKAISFIIEKSFVNGLTEKIKQWFEQEKNGI